MSVCDINLIATRRRQRQRALALMRLAVYSLIALFLGLTCLYAWLTVAVRMTEGRILTVQAELSDPKRAESMARVAFLERSIAQLEPRVKLLERVHDSEQAWITILHDVGACVPAPGNLWLSELTSRREKQEQTLSLRGSAFNQRDIGDFMLSLDRPGWSKAPSLGFTQSRTVGRGQQAIEFEITVPLTKPIGSNLK